MAHVQKEKIKGEGDNKDAAVQPDPETLHTSDPQENMEGPLSSLMQDIKEGFEETEQKDKGDANKEAK